MNCSAEISLTRAKSSTVTGAVASSASTAISAMTENSSIMGRALIFVALGEGIAIYGLLIAIQIINKIPL